LDLWIFGSLRESFWIFWIFGSLRDLLIFGSLLAFAQVMRARLAVAIALLLGFGLSARAQQKPPVTHSAANAQAVTI
jgi:hypothetical protein